jgi:hypothetical protein
VAIPSVYTVRILANVEKKLFKNYDRNKILDGWTETTMNPMIREILRRAGLKRITEGKNAAPSEQELETLVVQVVEECAKLVDENDSSWPFVSYSDMIKEHFGLNGKNDESI